jgi:hypothetical protein
MFLITPSILVNVSQVSSYLPVASFLAFFSKCGLVVVGQASATSFK